jgi:hypothetical protein
VFTRNALHPLLDFWKVLEPDRVVRMLRPGEVLRLHDLTFGLQPADTETVRDGRLARVAEGSAQGYIGENGAGYLRTEFGTFGWLLELMFAAFGLSISRRLR